MLTAVAQRLRDRAASPLQWPLADAQRAGVATGLTALAASLGLFDGADADVAAYAAEQRAEVAARHRRFAAAVPDVLRVLAEADVMVVPVKGAVLCGHSGAEPVWPDPSTRPMSDMDLLVPPRQRAQAGAALEAAGWRLHSTSAFEDTFLAWGDGGVGRTDGESAQHNGRIEVHPGWAEFLHGYVAHGASIDARWSAAEMTAHVIGHLASTVVRAEVRAVNVVDVWFLHRSGVSWHDVADVMIDVDPRLTGPGLWLADRVFPEMVPGGLLQRELRRMPAPDAFADLHPSAVLRDPTQRTTGRWRLSFAASGAERAAVARQMGGSVATRVTRRARRGGRGAHT